MGEAPPREMELAPIGSGHMAHALTSHYLYFALLYLYLELCTSISMFICSCICIVFVGAWLFWLLAQVTHCFRRNSKLTLVGLIFWFGLFVGTAIGCLGLLCQFHMIYLGHTNTSWIYFFLLWFYLELVDMLWQYILPLGSNFT